jgi:hypothetical protein
MSQRDRVTPEGQALGKQMARLAAKAIAEQKKQFPNMREPCATCAFKAGTIPNGCPQTLMDATKCLVEGVPFMCHHGTQDKDGNFNEFCVGWFASYSAISQRGGLKIECPFPFSEPDPS